MFEKLRNHDVQFLYVSDKFGNCYMDAPGSLKDPSFLGFNSFWFLD